MMNKNEALRTLGIAFRGLGLTGRGRRFRRDSDELLWLVDLESIPRTDRIGITVGVCPVSLAPEGLPKNANDCPVIFVPENGGEPFGIQPSLAWAALDLSADMAEAIRTEELRSLAKSIVDLVAETSSVEDLRRLAVAGRLRAILRKDARALLVR